MHGPMDIKLISEVISTDGRKDVVTSVNISTDLVSDNGPPKIKISRKVKESNTFLRKAKFFCFESIYFVMPGEILH